ncbi:OLC1v1030268C1 [Oldenlandia corymbosa var. corymbosa]|uniref:OLC1v1030268C1 n=1 Tax=Oldenlandia corymbosa var. corymbosa TaxID=529605 RepID=A0AAV1CHM7_OLDCO|nr:OLC1v1030268C1 [Oldenlandia corymbosa var. corymbosa]
MITGCEEWENLHKWGKTGRVGTNCEHHHREYIAKWNNRADTIVPGSPVSGQSSTDDDYLPWYKIKTIKFINDPNKYNFMEEGFREYSDRAKFYVEDYNKSKDVCQNSVCMNLLDEIVIHAMSALFVGENEMPILKPSRLAKFASEIFLTVGLEEAGRKSSKKKKKKIMNRNMILNSMSTCFKLQPSSNKKKTKPTKKVKLQEWMWMFPP